MGLVCDSRSGRMQAIFRRGSNPLGDAKNNIKGLANTATPPLFPDSFNTQHFRPKSAYIGAYRDHFLSSSLPSALHAHLFGNIGFFTILCVCISLVCLGFLPFNLSKMRVFMGEVGGNLLGFVFAGMVVLLTFHAIFASVRLVLINGRAKGERG